MSQVAWLLAEHMCTAHHIEVILPTRPHFNDSLFAISDKYRKPNQATKYSTCSLVKNPELRAKPSGKKPFLSEGKECYTGGEKKKQRKEKSEKLLASLKCLGVFHLL